MKNHIKIISSLLLVIFILCGCSGQNKIELQKPAYPVTAYNVTVEKAPEKIAVLSSYPKSIFENLNYSNKIIGYPDNEKVEGKETVGTEEAPDFEKIKQLAPEYIFTTTPLSYKQMKELDKLNVKLFVMTKKEDPKEMKDDYYNILAIMEGYVIADEKIDTIEIKK